jgi:hypothetical protein
MPEKLNRWCRTDGDFTFIGGILVGLTGIATLAFAWFLPFWLLPGILPPGTVYPTLILAIPIVLFGAVFFACGAWLIELLGLHVTKPKKEKL